MESDKATAYIVHSISTMPRETEKSPFDQYLANHYISSFLAQVDVSSVWDARHLARSMKKHGHPGNEAYKDIFVATQETATDKSETKSDIICNMDYARTFLQLYIKLPSDWLPADNFYKVENIMNNQEQNEHNFELFDNSTIRHANNRTKVAITNRFNQDEEEMVDVSTFNNTAHMDSNPRFDVSIDSDDVPSVIGFAVDDVSNVEYFG